MDTYTLAFVVIRHAASPPAVRLAVSGQFQPLKLHCWRTKNYAILHSPSHSFAAKRDIDKRMMKLR
jgi:hypothetical protein